MALKTVESYSIKKNGWGRFGRLRILWSSIAGMRAAYLAGILALACETFCIFVSPVIVKVTIDSVIGSSPVELPVFLEPAGRALFGIGYEGGGLIPLPARPAASYAGGFGEESAAGGPGDGDGAVGTAGAGSSDGGRTWPWRDAVRGRLWLVAAAFLAVVLLQGAASFASSWCANASAEHAAKRLRDRLYGGIQDLPYETLLRAQSGDWLQRCTSDVDTTRRFIAQEFMEIVRTLFLVSFALPSMYSLSPRLTFWGTLVIPLILAYSFGFHKLVEHLFLGADEREGVLSGIVQENVTGIRVVRAFARQEYEQTRFNRANDRYRDQVFKLIAWLGVFWGFSSLLGIVQIGIVLGAGLSLYAEGAVQVGMIVLFLSYEHQTLWPVRQFGRVLADTGKTKVALGRIAELCALAGEDALGGRPDKEEDSPAESAALAGKLPVEFRNVSFTYPDGTAVLRGVSFRMEAGERLAVVGPTGSGKSTLVHLLLRLYEPTSGEILVGGRNIRDIPKRVLRSAISLVPQESFLYGKTIRDNIRLGDEGIEDGDIFEASRASSLESVIEGFPHGYETMVGERGVTLSGGQRQRLSLARAVVRKASILVLDDSLSAVDTETDARIRESLDSPDAGMVVVAHRLTTLASADKIIVLEDGEVTAIGTHEDLISRPGLYRRLAELQSAVAAQDSGSAV